MSDFSPSGCDIDDVERRRHEREKKRRQERRRRTAGQKRFAQWFSSFHWNLLVQCAKKSGRTPAKEILAAIELNARMRRVM